MAEDHFINGINVTQLTSTIDQIRNEPEIAKFSFRATNTWVDGTHCQGTVQHFYGALTEDTKRPPLTYDMDEPPVLMGHNTGRNPVEFLLIALSGCLTTTLVAYASAKGLNLKGVQSWYEGDIDLRGFLGISDEVRAGYQRIRVGFRIDADISDEQKQELVQLAQQHSPVFNTISRSSPVSVHLER
ncbi:MAG: OsmC family protein [Desulfomonilia bacterium]|jgi:uncharacterized OsmC-like protein|uniref:OsmC-like protein n=1 Tax=anaerobic digester metagenome TaxID=1263854 RepID=A0A485LVT0_9ZZZZ|nr:OsmC family protein [Pseudomonadota bacterium]HON39351.1 OsmC family protein [Deltaproteobacteria bacterium]HRS57167.1 OsmC family protein [Desulfomonilia bacterium]HPD22367.1 OsmC family protein [Deltaproteobacteria bacterium]HPX18717.1 OsmC family protein [Deltaproteobacteria bacterium]